MSNRDHKMPDRFPNESVAEITDIALTKIEKNANAKNSKNLKSRVY